MKRLFVDIETSPDIGFFWRTGYKLNIQPEAIIRERAIICICYKWEDKPTIHALSWDKGDDNELLEKFAEVSDKADEFIGHNLDRFDLPWINSRRLINGMEPAPPCKTVDTPRS
jgi:DNA polymerase elongation subunit (family B)